jgi:hypothetical protein
MNDYLADRSNGREARGIPHRTQSHQPVLCADVRARILVRGVRRATPHQMSAVAAPDLHQHRLSTRLLCLSPLLISAQICDVHRVA